MINYLSDQLSPEEYTNAANNIQRTPFQTGLASAESAFISPFNAIGILGRTTGIANALTSIEGPTQPLFTALGEAIKGLGENDEGSTLLRKLSVDSSTPNMGWGQWGGNQIGNVIGMMANPINWMGFSAGTFAARSAISGLEKIAPEFVTNALTKKFPELLGTKLPGRLAEESLGSLGAKGAIGFSGLTASSVPQAISDQYDQNTGHIHWGGVAKESAEMGGFGIAMGAIPFAVGTIFGKLRGALKTPLPEEFTPEHTSALDDGLKSGAITAEEHQFAKDYKENPNDPTLSERATKILAMDGHNVDHASNNVNFPILSGDDVRNLQSAASDQLGSDVPLELKSSLSDFITHNSLDNLRETIANKPSIKNGIQGYIDFINAKLAKKPEELQTIKDISNKYLKENIRKKHPYSQESILRAVKENPREHIQLTIPSDVYKRVGQQNELQDLYKKIKVTRREYIKSNQESQDHLQNKNYIDHANARDKAQKLNNKILDLEKQYQEKEATLHPLKGPKEETEDLEKRLLPEGKPKEGYEATRDYKRLLDLAPASPAARGLLYRLHITKEYERQEAFKNILSTLMKVNDAPVPQLANKEQVAEYLKQRIDAKLAKQELPDIKSTRERADQLKDVPSDIHQTLADQKSTVMESSSSELKSAFKETENRIKQFEKSTDVLNNLISCVKGVLNA